MPIIPELRRSAKQTARRALTRALDRVVDGTIMVSEYPLDPKARYGWDQPPHAGLQALLAAGNDRYCDTFEQTTKHLDWFRSIPRDRQEHGVIAWDNDYWGMLDAAVQCTALIDRRPALYLEVGSGYSTMFARRTITDHQLPTKIVSIDPFPRAEIDALCDEVIRLPFQETDIAALAARLAPGDVVLLDGSHTAFMDGDTIAMFFDLLPVVPPGVLVGIDDVFLPWDYHPTWVGRWYAEQYLLGTFLLGGGGGWDVVAPDWYVTNAPELAEVRGRLDPVVGPRGVTFWLERPR